MPAEEQVVVLYAGVKGYLDKVQTSDIAEFERLYMEFIKTKYASLLTTIKTEGQITDATNNLIMQVLDEFIPQSGLVTK
jgi:F0F1-type ATP synthase alpha subunit